MMMAEGAEERRRQGIVRRVSIKWTNQTLSGCWESWLEFMEKQQRVRGVIDRAVMRMSHGDAYSGLTAWKEWHAFIVRAQAVTKRVAIKWRNQTISVCFETWLCWMDDQRRIRDIVRKAVHRMLHADLSCGMRSWRGVLRRQS